MFTNHADCSKCGHCAVCSYKGRHHDFENDIKKASERGGLAEDKDIFSVVITCRQWTPINNFIRRVNEICLDEQGT